MPETNTRRRKARRITVTAAALAAVGALALVPSAQAGAGPDGGQTTRDAERTALAKKYDKAKKRFVDLQLLALNDFHGNLEPPSGSSGRVTELQADGTTKTIDAGGAEYLATALRTARANHPYSFTVAAGDIVGASPLLSGLFHDEPTIEAMNAMGLDVTGVGNHEFDEGARELIRLQKGGCHPTDGCYSADRTYLGADFPILAANVTWEKNDKTILKPYAIKKVNGVKVGFIGVTLEGTPNVVTAEGVKGLKFADEVETVNKYTKILKKKEGVDAVVALIHEGGTPTSTAYNYDCDAGGNGSGISDPIATIAKGIDPEVDAIVTGHTHQAYVCTIDDPAGNPRLVTSASSYGRLFTELNMVYDRKTGEIVRTSVDASNKVVTRTVDKAPDITELLNYWKALAAPVSSKTVGYISGDISRTDADSLETPLGDVIGDAQLAYAKTLDSGADLAVMNPGGIRADLVYTASGTEGDGVVSYGEAFAVQPFSNTVNLKDLTGAQLITVLQQQVSGTNLASPKILQISSGLTYTLDMTRTGADRIIVDSVKLGGVPIDTTATYRVAMNSFLAGGGDGFTELANGTNQLVGGDDLAALTAYLTAGSSAAAPLAAPAADRITIVK